MNVSKRHIEGSTQILGPASATPTSSIVIPLLPPQGSWVITGIVQGMRADGLHGPVTFFPRFTGSCAKGVATPNNTGKIPTQPVDGGGGQGFQPGGLSLVGADERGPQMEIALTGVAGVAIFWAWELDVVVMSLP